MHKIQAKEFIIDDFSTDQITAITADDISLEDTDDCDYSYYKHRIETTDNTVKELNLMRRLYLAADRKLKVQSLTDAERKHVVAQRKRFWWNMIQLLPSSYNQTRNVMMNYEVLANIYKSRKDHKLDEWREFCKWITSLPQSELITEPIVKKASTLGWRPISEYHKEIHGRVLANMFIKDLRCQPIIASMGADGKWYDGDGYPVAGEVREFFDPKVLDERRD